MEPTRELNENLFSAFEELFAMADSHSVEAVYIDCQNRNVKVDFLSHSDEQNEDGQICSDAVAYYDMMLAKYRDDEKVTRDFEQWKMRLLKDPTDSQYRQFVGRQVDMLLGSDFLVLDEWMTTDDDSMTLSELEGWGLASARFGDRYCLLRQMVDLRSGRFCIDRGAVGKYFITRGDQMTNRGMRRFFHFVLMCEAVYADIDQRRRAEGKTAKEPLSRFRQTILDRLLAFAAKGDWLAPATVGGVQEYLRTVLGEGERVLTEDDSKLSSVLWNMLEQGRGEDRVVLVMQNLIGYFVSRGWLASGSPRLNLAFFGTQDNYSNIDKGNPQSNNLSQKFLQVLPLLNKTGMN